VDLVASTHVVFSAPYLRAVVRDLRRRCLAARDRHHARHNLQQHDAEAVDVALERAPARHGIGRAASVGLALGVLFGSIGGPRHSRATETAAAEIVSNAHMGVAAPCAGEEMSRHTPLVNDWPPWQSNTAWEVRPGAEAHRNPA